MAGKKSTRKQKDSDTRVGEITGQLEHAFMAGIGALSDAQKKGARTFDALVKEGEKFRRKTTSRTENLIDDVQEAIRDMAEDAQSKATGLLDQVRGKSRLDKLQSAFDTRVADTMDRLNVPSKNDIDAINQKLNQIIRLLKDPVKPAAKPKATRKKTTGAATTKKAARSVKKTSK